MKRVDSQALGIVNTALGLTGHGAQNTEFLDGQVDQTLDVAPLVRRGRTQAGTTGLYYGIIQNAHTIADTIQTTFVIDAHGTDLDVAPFPSPFDFRLFDLWLLNASILRTAGASTLSAALFLECFGSQGWGVLDTGLPAVATRNITLAYWDTLVTQSNSFGLTPLQNKTIVPINLRMGSGWRLTLSTTSSAAGTFSLTLMLGVFPVGLGQDAAL